jgi:hypothetical protein
MAKSQAGRGTQPALFAREEPTRNGAAERKKAIAAAARASQLEAELATARHSEDVNKTRAAELERELSETRLSEKTNATHLSQMQSDLSKVRESDEQKESRVAQLERQLAEARLSEKTTAARLSQLETDLATSHRADEEKGVRLAQVEMDLQSARQSTDQAKAEVKRVASAEGPRLITPEQRRQFMESVRGLPTGKVLVSAFFENSETHHFGAELLNLFKAAGFSVVERAPLSFFTTSRPSSGVRIGCQDINNPPPQFETVRNALGSIGLEASTTNIINADEDDVVEIQVTPKQ